jgi:hypothetical protein
LTARPTSVACLWRNSFLLFFFFFSLLFRCRLGQLIYSSTETVIWRKPKVDPMLCVGDIAWSDGRTDGRNIVTTKIADLISDYRLLTIMTPSNIMELNAKRSVDSGVTEKNPRIALFCPLTPCAGQELKALHPDREGRLEGLFYTSWRPVHFISSRLRHCDGQLGSWSRDHMKCMYTCMIRACRKLM